MGQILNKLITEKIKNDNENLFKNVPEEQREEYQNSLKEKLETDIINEIVEEEAEKIASKVTKIRKEKRIKEIKNTILSGLFLSFFLGLIVNQLTDIIGYLKGSVPLNSMAPTLWILAGLSVITIFILFLLFIDSILNLLNEKEE